MQNLRIKVLYGLYIDKFLRVNDEKSNKLPTDYKEVSFTIGTIAIIAVYIPAIIANIIT